MRKKLLYKKLAPYGYIMPIALILFTFVVLSVVLLIIFSFTKYNIISEPVFYGIRNYKRLLSDTKFQVSVGNTIKLMLIIVPIQTVLAMTISILLAKRKKTILGRLANAVIFIPVLSSNAVVGTIWKALLNGQIPFVDGFFALFGVQSNMLLGDTKLALVTVGMISVWKMLGYYVVIYTSALTGIDNSFYEAAKVDGAGWLKEIRYITLPMLKPTIVLSVFLGITSSMQSFDIIYNLTGGGPAMSTTTLVYYAYDLCFKSNKAGYAMTISNILFLIILGTALLQKNFIRREASEIY